MALQELPLGFSEFLIPTILFVLTASFVFSCIAIKKRYSISFPLGDVYSNGIQQEACTTDDVEGQCNNRIQKSIFCSADLCFKVNNCCKRSDSGTTRSNSESTVASVDQELLPDATQKENTANLSVTQPNMFMRCFKRKGSANIVHVVVPPHAKNEGCKGSDNPANLPVMQSNIFIRCFKGKGSSKVVHIDVPPDATLKLKENKRSDSPANLPITRPNIIIRYFKRKDSSEIVHINGLPDSTPKQEERSYNPGLSTIDETAQATNDNLLRSLFENREKHINMEREEKRKLYIKTNPVTEKEIPTWDTDPKNAYPVESIMYKVDEEINKKISIWKGDITRLEIDAIVNAANHHLRGGGGVDGAIHRAAGPDLLKENMGLLKECPIGEARVAAGYRLPAYYIIHTNGPQDSSREMLEKCYKNCLSEVLKNKIRTVAFPGISTGVYGFPMKEATHVAAKTVREWLENNKEHVDRIIFCAYQKKAAKAAYKIFPEYFPKKVSSDNNC